VISSVREIKRSSLSWKLDDDMGDVKADSKEDGDGVD